MNFVALTAKRLLPLLVLLGATVSAHHAPTLYDNDRLMQLEGEVVELKYRFPHSELIVKTDAGQEWTVSLAPPDVSEKQGKKEDLLAIKPGEPVTVYGWPHRVKDFEIRSHKLLFSDDRVIDGAVNSLYEPKAQKDLRKLLADPAQLSDLEAQISSGDTVPLLPGRSMAREPMSQLALDIHNDRAGFIGIRNDGLIRYPGIKEHLLCLPQRNPHTIYADLNDEAMIYVGYYNEWLARYLEGQLQICEFAGSQTK